MCPKVAKRMAINSMKKRIKTVMSAMPSAKSYEVIGPVRQGSVKASQAGARSCAVLAWWDHEIDSRYSRG